jgi:hypothetical protein
MNWHDDIPTSKEFSVTNQLPTKTQIDAVQRYLEREFPGSRRRTWWDENMQAQVFELMDSDSLRRIGIDVAIFQNASDEVKELRESDFVDYIRWSRAPRRWFRVTWSDGGLHIRSKPL